MGKAPDGIGGKVLSGDIVINTPKKFAKLANETSNVDCLYLPKEQLLRKPEEVAKAATIPTILKIYKARNSFVNKFYYLSEYLEAFFTLKYGVQCGHKVTDIFDDNICNH